MPCSPVEVPPIASAADPGLSAGLVCFELDGLDPDEVVRRLATRRIDDVEPYARRYVRLGPGIVNFPADVDAVVRAVAAL